MKTTYVPSEEMTNLRNSHNLHRLPSQAMPTIKHRSLRTLQVLIAAIAMLFAVGVNGAWADQVILSAPTASATSHSDGNNVVTITDATGNTGIQVGSGTFTIDGTSYTPMKLSGSRQFNITYSNKVDINSVTLYYRENNTTGTATLGTTSSDRTSIGTMPDKNSDPATANITSIAGLNASAQFLAVIVVNYTPKEGIEKSHDATLKSITVYGSAIDGFASATKVYDFTLAYGTTAIPTVGAASTDANATTDVTQATTLPGTATINVTAEDETTTDVYTVNLSVSSTAPTVPTGYDKFWRAEDWDKMVASSNLLTINDMSIYNVAVDVSGQVTADGLGTVSKRFNFGGAGGIGDTSRRIEIPITGPCTVTVFGSNGNVGRSVTISDGTNLSTVCTTTDDNKNTLITESYEYTGSAEKLYLYSTTSGFYIYGFGIKYTSSPDPGFEPYAIDLTAENSAQNTPQGWTAVSLPSITVNKEITLSGLSVSGDNAPAIQEAINAASDAGGGKVIIPSGEWLSGQLFIKSNVVLHLSKNCTLKMLPYGTYPAGKDNYFIGTGSETVNDVIIEGEDHTSIIDGQGAGWWSTFDSNNDTRPAGLVRFSKGTRYLVRNIQFQNSPKPNLVLGQSGNASHFTVHDVKIVNPDSDDAVAKADGFAGASHNTDGIPVWGPYSNIYRCNISTGDDNVVFDSNAQYGHVWDCDFGRGHGASIGSNTMNVHDIIWDNIRFNGTQSGFKIKTDRGKGNELYNITYQNSTMTGVRDILYLDCWYGESTKPTPGAELEASAPVKGETTPAWHDITYKNITATDCVSKSSDKNGFPIYFYGLPESHIKNVTLDNVTIEGQKGMFMAYVGENEANGVTFQNGCSITNVKEPTAAAFVTDYSAVHNDEYITGPAPEWESIEMTLNAAGLLTAAEITSKEAVDFGISVDASGNVIRVAKGASNAIGSISGNYHSDHGMNLFSMTLNVPGAVKITAGTCSFGTTQVKVNGTAVGDAVVGDNATTCWKNNHSNVATGIYKGEAGEITITTGSYTPYIKIEKYNAADEPQDDPDGIYDAVVSNVAQLKSALTHSGTASKQYKILVKNGTYDLGTEIQTPVKSYVSLIGESRDGVILKNEPTQEGIQTSVLLLVNGIGTDIENMTLQCTVANSGNGERSVVIWDKGQDNIFRNLKLVGRQDTYSSDGKPEGAKSYFEDCHIMGTVDFICGNGNVMFENCILDLQQRSAGDVITAPSTYASETGFVFNNCTIQGDSGQEGKYYLARGWKNDPKATFLNTTMMITPSSGGISPSDASNSVNSKTWKEYGSKNASGAAANVTSYVILESDANTIISSVVGTLGTDEASLLIELSEPIIADNKLKWKSDTRAIGYYIYKNGTKVATMAAPSATSSRVRRAPAATEDMEYAIDDPSAAWSVGAINAKGAVGKAAAAPAAPVGPTTETMFSFGTNTPTSTTPTAEGGTLTWFGTTVTKLPWKSGTNNSVDPSVIQYGVQFTADNSEEYIKIELNSPVTENDKISLMMWTAGTSNPNNNYGLYVCSEDNVNTKVLESTLPTEAKKGYFTVEKDFAGSSLVGKSVIYLKAKCPTGKSVFCSQILISREIPEQIETVIYDLKTGVGSAVVGTNDTATGLSANTTYTEKEKISVGASKDWAKITCAPGYKFKNGDKLVVNGTPGNTTKAYSLQFFTATDKATEVAAINKDKSVVGNPTEQYETTLTLASDVEELYIFRVDGTTMNITDLTITGLRDPSPTPPTPTYPITATWDFKNGVPSTITTVNLEGKTGKVASDKDGIELDVDATSGKLKYNTSGYAQFNQNTIIKVPVTSKYDEVRVVAYPGQHSYTIGGVTVSNDDTKYTAVEGDVTKGYVEIKATATAYIYSITVTQQGVGYVPTVDWTPTWDEANTRWVVKTSSNADEATKATENAEGLKKALEYLAVAANVAGKNKTLFIPNGTYDLGKVAKTPLRTGMHLIGESQDGVLIKNQLEEECINATATLYISKGAENVVIETLTIKCRAPYGITTGGVASNAERGVCVQDEGRNTHYINVTMDGLQDTYYSNGDAGMTAQFDNCTIMGNVDFFCGSGDITVNNSRLLIVSTHNVGESPVICAPATYTEGETQGYLFNNCTIEAAPSSRGNAFDCVTAGHATNVVDNGYYLARAWYNGSQTDKTPRVTFQNTEFIIEPLDYWTTMGSSQPGGAPIFTVISNNPEYSPEAKVIEKTNKPFGFVTATDRTKPASVNPGNITGGGAVTVEEALALAAAGDANVITLTSDGVTPMDTEIKNAINGKKIIILDGGNTETTKKFIISEVIELKGLTDKTIIGINGARLCTEFFLTERYKYLLDNAGVKGASTASGTGGTFKYANGKEISINEEEEYLTRKTLYEAVEADYQKKYPGEQLNREPYKNAGIFYFDNCSNFVLRNLKLEGPGSVDVGGTDLMSIINGSNHFWVDHCEFTDGIDGNFDITNGSDFITVSWCKFFYTERAYAHENSNLVGSDDNKTEMDTGKLNITFAYNEWGAGCDGRMPMARFGKIHMLNNYYTCNGNTQNAMNPRKNSEFLIEGNLWSKGVTKTYKEDGGLNVTWEKDNVIKDSKGTAGTNKGTQPVTVPYQYNGLKLDVNNLPDILSLNGGAVLGSSPVFTTDLPEEATASLTDAREDGITLSVWAENAHTFQWYIKTKDLQGNYGDWTKIAGATRNSYSYKTTKGEQIQLQCIAYGIAGTATSNTITLTIQDDAKPVFVLDLDDTEIKEVITGEPLEFTVNAGDPATGVTYQWYKYNADSEKSSATAIDGATAMTYSYNPAQAEVAYIFCRATNSQGSTDSKAVKVKGTYRDIKFHYFGKFNYTTHNSEDEIHGGTGGVSTFHTDCTAGCKASLNSMGDEVLHNKVSGIRVETCNNAHGAEGFASNTYIEYTLEQALVAGHTLKLSGFTGSSDSPAGKYGFYVCTGATKTAENTIATLSLTKGKNVLEESKTTISENLAGGTKLYVIPFVDGIGKNVTMHDLIVYTGEDIPCDAVAITKDLEDTYAVSVGKEVNLRIEATDAASYQWYKNTENTATIDDANKITGATEPTYTFTPDAEGTDYYYCYVTGLKAGTYATSNVAAVVATINNSATVTYAYDHIKAGGVGVSEPEGIMNEMSVTPTGTLAWYSKNGSNVDSGFALVQTSATTKAPDDAIKFVIAPIEGKKLLPTTLTLSVARFGTDGGEMEVYANGMILTEKNLNKQTVKPKRNGSTECDGTDFAYDLSDFSATLNEPLNIAVCVKGMGSNKQWGIANLQVDGSLKDDVVTDVANPKATVSEWVPAEEAWEYTLTTATEGAHIHYQIEDAEPVEVESTSVTLNIGYGKSFKFWASDPSGTLNDSKTITETSPAMKQLKTPTINRGVYTHPTAYPITITNIESGAKVYYTTDGTEPTTASTEYSAAFNVGSEVTIKALAVKEHYANSAVVSATTHPVSDAGTDVIIKSDVSSSKDYVTAAYTVPGTYVGGTANNLTTGIKVNCRSNTDVTNGMRIKVNEGFAITSIKISAINNYNTDATLDAVKIDGENKLAAPVNIPTATPKKPIDIDLIDNFIARNYIDLIFTETANATDTKTHGQINVNVEVTYEFDDAPSAIRVADYDLTDDEMTNVKTGTHIHTMPADKVYADDPEVVVTTKLGYQYTIPGGNVDDEKYTHFTKTMVGISYTVRAKVSAIKSPNIEIGSFSIKGGYKVDLNGVDYDNTTPYINIDGETEADGTTLKWTLYDPSQTYYALKTVQSRCKYEEGGADQYTEPRVANCPANSYEAGKPFAVFVRQPSYLDSQDGANPYDSTKPEAEDKIYQALQTNFNVVDFCKPSGTEVLKEMPDIADAKLVVITEMISGSGSYTMKRPQDPEALDTKSTALTMTLLRDVVDKTNVINFKMFTYSQSKNNTDRWGWAQPAALPSGVISINPVEPNGGGMYEVFSEARMNLDGSITLWNDANDEKPLNHLQPVFNFNEGEHVPGFYPLAMAVDPDNEEEEYHILHYYDKETDGKKTTYVGFGLSVNEWTAYNDNVKAIIEKIGEMIIAGRPLNSKLEKIVDPKITDNGDGSAMVMNNNFSAKTYYLDKTESDAAPSADDIISSGSESLAANDFHTIKYTTDKIIYAVSTLGAAQSNVVSARLEGSVIRYVTRISDDPESTGLMARYPFEVNEDGTAKEFNFPYNQSWKKEGYTVTKWVDAEGNEYTPGKSYDDLTQDITVKAVWTPNTHKITDLGKDENEENRTVTWEFLQSKGAPALAMESKAGNMQAILVGQVKFADGTWLDVPMTINTDHTATLPDNGTEYHGKFNNVSTNWVPELVTDRGTFKGSDYAQVRTGTQFTFPMVYGSNVVYKALDLVERDATTHEANGNVNRPQISQSYITDGTNNSGELNYWLLSNPGYKLTPGWTGEEGSKVLQRNSKIVFEGDAAQLATTSPTYDQMGYDNGGGNFNYGGLIYYDGDATMATLTSVESAQYIHVGDNTGKKLGSLNYGSCFMQSLSVTYPALYDLTCTWVAVGNTENPHKSELDPEENPGKIEKLNDPRPNCGGRYVLYDDITLKLTPSYGYYVDKDNAEVKDDDGNVTTPAYYFMKDGESPLNLVGVNSKIYRYKDADYADYSDDIKANIPEDGAYITMKVQDIDLVVSMKEYPSRSYSITPYPGEMGVIEYNTGTGRTPENEYKQFPDGKTIIVTAAPKMGYKFKGWKRTSETGEDLVTGNGITIGDGKTTPNPFDPDNEDNKLEKNELAVVVSESNADPTYYAIFEEGVTGMAHYQLGSALEQYVENGEKKFCSFTLDPEDKNVFPEIYESTALNIPYYYTLFKNGYTLDHWLEPEPVLDGDGNPTYADGHQVFKPVLDSEGNHVYSKTYKIGTFYYFENPGEHRDLIPVFTKNPISYDHRAVPVDITWDFRSSKFAQRMNFNPKEDSKYATQTIYYSTHALINNEHLMDVPLRITLGNKGRLKNDSDDEWCSIGEGTEIVIPSGIGAKFTIASLSRMTTTQFVEKDGLGNVVNSVVPTSYTKKNENGVDVYYYTYITESTSTSITLKIGDDYSYYKSLRAELPAADAVPLKATTNNPAFGGIEITAATHTDGSDRLEEIKATKVSLPDVDGQSGATYTLGLGTTITLTAKRNHLYVVDYFEDIYGTKYYWDSKKTGNIRAVAADGKDVSDAARTNNGICMAKVADFNGNNNDIELTFMVNEYDNHIHVVYKENKLYQINYGSGEEAEGEAPGIVLIEEGESFKVPDENHYLYVDGQTLKYWVDAAGNKYDFGENYTPGQPYTATKDLPSGLKSGDSFDVPLDNLFLSPHFDVNEFTVMNLSEEAKAVWPLTRIGKSDADNPAGNYSGNNDVVIYFQKSEGIYVTPLKLKDGRFIDLKLDMKCAKTGKIDNQNNGERCQINGESEILVPSSSNCEISLYTVNGKLSTTTIAGADGSKDAKDASDKVVATHYTSTPVYGSNEKATVAYTGDDTKVPIEFMGEAGYFYQIEAIYKHVETQLPKLDYVTIDNIALGALGTPLANKKLSTIRDNGQVDHITADLSNSTTGNMPLVKAMATNNGIVEITQATIDKPVATLLVKTRDGITVSVHKVLFDVTPPQKAPIITDLKVSGRYQCDLDKLDGDAIDINRNWDDVSPEGSYIYGYKDKTDSNDKTTDEYIINITNAGINGTIAIRFNKPMKAANVNVPALGQTISAEEGQTLVFSYWNLDLNKEYDFIIPKNTFEDIYGNEYAHPVRLHFTTVKTATEVENRLINFVVTHNQPAKWDQTTFSMVADGTPQKIASDDLIKNLDAAGIPHGTLDEGIALANAAKNNADQRFYIFVPDGEYQLKGNVSIQPSFASSSYAPADNTGKLRDELLYKSNGNKPTWNGITEIARSNVSITGQSEDKTIVWNRPEIEGISYTATFRLNNGTHDFYAQDMTWENRFDYKTSIAKQGAASAQAARAVVLQDRSAKSIFKNINLKSYQDTYYSNPTGEREDTRYYFENCSLSGYVDFLCGSGDVWLEKCNLYLRAGKGTNAANIMAPQQYASQLWGYVFNRCNIYAEDDAQNINNGKFTIARPWSNSPASTLLYTTFHVLPTNDGYKAMSNTGVLLRMHEYRSYYPDGTLIDLSQRSLRNSSPGAGSYDAVMTPSEAERYTVFNAMGGNDGYNPTIYTRQVNMKTNKLRQDDTSLTWDKESEALCYFIFRKDNETDTDWKLFTVTADTDFELEDSELNKWFCIRAANQRGGLGDATEPLQYIAHEAYRRELINNNQVIDGWRWSTIYLDFDAKAPIVQHEKVDANGIPVVDANGDPVMEDEIFVYALVKVDATKLTFKRVKIMEKNVGYLVKARPRPEEYEFKYTEKTPVYYNGMTVPEYRTEKSLSAEDFPHMSLMNGSVVNKSATGTSGYTLASKTSYGLGFYKYTGSQYNAYYGWLDAALVAEAQKALADGSLTNEISAQERQAAKAGYMRMVFDDDIAGNEGKADDITDIFADPSRSIEGIYTLSGQRITEGQLQPGRIYIINGKKVLVK